MRKQLTIVGTLSIVAAMLVGRTSSGEPDAGAPAAAPVVPAPAAAGHNPPAVVPVQPVQAVPAQVQIRGNGGGGMGGGGFGRVVGAAAAQGLRVEPNNGVLQIFGNPANAFSELTNPAGANQDQNPKAAEIAEAMRALRASEDPAEKADLKMRLENALTDYFDEDMKNREAELSNLEERVKKLRSQLDRRSKAKTEIIQLQLKVLNNDAEGLGFSNAVSPVSDPRTSATGNQSIYYSSPATIQLQQPLRVNPPVAVPAKP